MPQEHELKCWPQYFKEVIAQRKPFEIRKDDRGFCYGDVLYLREWEPHEGYTGRECKFEVTAVYRDVPGLLPDHVAMTIERRAPGDRAGLETSVAPSGKPDARINAPSEPSACDHSVVMSAATMDAAYQRRWCAKCGATV